MPGIKLWPFEKQGLEYKAETVKQAAVAVKFFVGWLSLSEQVGGKLVICLRLAVNFPGHLFLLTNWTFSVAVLKKKKHVAKKAKTHLYVLNPKNCTSTCTVLASTYKKYYATFHTFSSKI